MPNTPALSELQRPADRAIRLVAEQNATIEGLRAQLRRAAAALNEAIVCLEMADPEGRHVWLVAPEDHLIRDLCERRGYGAVIDSAVRQWRRKDPVGAHTQGMCVETLTMLLKQLREAVDDGHT